LAEESGRSVERTSSDGVGREGVPHAVVDSAAAETALGNLEGAAFAEDEVLGWDPDVFVLVLAVALRSPVVA
jgi:hypothetical protein